MKALVALLAGALTAAAVGAQIVPLGVPVIPQPKRTVGQQSSGPSQQPLGQMRAARPLGSNYSPYNIQPQGSITASAPSAVAADRPVSSGIVTDPNAVFADDASRKRAKTASTPSDMQKLAPKAPERTELPQADTSAPTPK